MIGRGSTVADRAGSANSVAAAVAAATRVALISVIISQLLAKIERQNQDYSQQC
jgi:hypothetical protein